MPCTEEELENFRRFTRQAANDAALLTYDMTIWHYTTGSGFQDDINQWLKYGGEHGENGYAIGFRAIGLRIDGNTVVVRVNYDNALHRRLAEDAARLTGYIPPAADR